MRINVEFRNYFEDYYGHINATPQPSVIDSESSRYSVSLGTIGRPVSKPSRTRSELDCYLSDDLFFHEDLLQNPLEMWKQIHLKYPTVAKMAKDILSIPASGVGVERLFNTARDVCFYRRNRLNSTTIEMIMQLKWYEKLGLASSDENSDFFSKDSEGSKKANQLAGNVADVELWIDEQPASESARELEVDWESDSGSDSD